MNESNEEKKIVCLNVINIKGNWADWKYKLFFLKFGYFGNQIATNFLDTLLFNYQNICWDAIMKWINNSELLNISGIYEHIVILLFGVEVNTIQELSIQDSDHLFRRLQQVNYKIKLIRNFPRKNVIEYWVKQAKTMSENRAS